MRRVCAMSPGGGSMSERTLVGSEADWRELATPAAVRRRCGQLLTLAETGGTHFEVVSERASDVVERVASVTLRTYPDLRIPLHARWGHFQAGGVDRLGPLRTRLASLSPQERVRAWFDLAIVSVLLDAGAGADWRYCDPASGQVLARSEGLAVASLRLFEGGGCSSDPQRPWQADANGLRALDARALGATFQVTAANPLVGLQGRVDLLGRLACAIESDSQFFPGIPARPGNLAEACRTQAEGLALPAARLFQAVLQALAPVWPAGLVLVEASGTRRWPLGDVWPHPALGEPGSPRALVPFHKLTQWLTYSLIEPLVEAGVRVVDLDHLTTLAEYRNGGLLLDMGWLRLRDPRSQDRPHAVSDPLVVEWRALTVALIDRLAGAVRTRLGSTAENLSLAHLLEGGTWRAGREVAAERRPGGGPPLELIRDGTVF